MPDGEIKQMHPLDLCSERVLELGKGYEAAKRIREVARDLGQHGEFVYACVDAELARLTLRNAVYNPKEKSS